MRFARIGPWLSGVAVVAGSTFAAESQDVRKKRLAVLDFEYGIVRSETNELFGVDMDVGRGMAALLVKYLVRD